MQAAEDVCGPADLYFEGHVVPVVDMPVETEVPLLVDGTIVTNDE